MCDCRVVFPTVYQAEQGDLRLRIVVDEYAENPRGFENLGTMVFWHRRYQLGDKHDFATPDDFIQFARKRRVVKLPVYFYDHGEVVLSTRPFHDPWDSGQIGWIYATYDKIKKWFGVSKVTSDVVAKAEKALEQEVKTYNDYVNGNVYGFILERKVVCKCCNGSGYEMIDSCFGFYGTDFEHNGLLWYLGDEYAPLLRQLQYVST